LHLRQPEAQIVSPQRAALAERGPQARRQGARNQQERSPPWQISAMPLGRRAQPVMAVRLLVAQRH
jgi:hypothetical protein